MTLGERGQATGASAITNFGLALLVGAVLTWITRKIASPLLALDPAGGGEVASKSTQWLQVVVDNQPVLFLFYAFFSLVALAIYQREVLRA